MKNWKQISGAATIVVGVIFLFVAYSIEGRLDEGRQEISRGESQVNQGRRLFSGSPVSKEVGNQLLFNSADRKIAEGKQEISQYSVFAQQLRVGGIILILIGAGVIYFFRKD